jgi:hypothetical protein
MASLRSLVILCDEATGQQQQRVERNISHDCANDCGE